MKALSDYSEQDLGTHACLYAKRGKTVAYIADLMGITEDDVLHYMHAVGGCSCGSGYQSWWHKDARGIELFKGCDKCAPGKLKRYRPEVLTNSNYQADEPIEPEDY